MIRILILLLAMAPILPAKTKTDERLKKITKVTITGESRAATRAREVLRKGGSCFVEVVIDDADATMEISEQSSALADKGLLSVQRAAVTATVTLKNGDPIWIRTASFPVSSSVEASIHTATDILLKFLAGDADCKSRKN